MNNKKAPKRLDFTEQQSQTIIQKLEKLRLKKGYSYSELAKLSGKSLTGLIGFREQRSITPAMANALCRVFGFNDWEEMLNSDESQPTTKEEGQLNEWQASVEARLRSLEAAVHSLQNLGRTSE